MLGIRLIRLMPRPNTKYPTKLSPFRSTKGCSSLWTSEDTSDVEREKEEREGDFIFTRYVDWYCQVRFIFIFTVYTTV